MSSEDYDYFLEHSIFGVKQVTRDEWIQAERSAGFYPKHGGDGPATGGFSGNGMSGFMRPKKVDNKLRPVKVYPDRRTLRDDLMDRGIL